MVGLLNDKCKGPKAVKGITIGEKLKIVNNTASHHSPPIMKEKCPLHHFCNAFGNRNQSFKH